MLLVVDASIQSANKNQETIYVFFGLILLVDASIQSANKKLNIDKYWLPNQPRLTRQLIFNKNPWNKGFDWQSLLLQLAEDSGNVSWQYAPGKQLAPASSRIWRWDLDSQVVRHTCHCITRWVRRKLKAPLWLLFWRASKTPLPGSSPFFGVIVSYKLILLTEYLASMACHTPILGPVIPRWSLPQTKSKGTNWLDCVDSSPGARVFLIFIYFIIIQPNKFSHFGRVTPFPTTFYPSFPAEWAALPVAATPQGRFGTRRRAALGLVASRGSSLDSRRRNLVLHGAFPKIQAYNQWNITQRVGPWQIPQKLSQLCRPGARFGTPQSWKGAEVQILVPSTWNPRLWRGL